MLQTTAGKRPSNLCSISPISSARVGHELFYFALILVLSAFPAFAGETTGTILGTVQDEAGAVVPGATVTVTSKATQAVRSTTTDGQGRFALLFLEPGTYEVAVEETGFQRYVDSNVVLSVGQKLRVDVQLQVGSVRETVTVSGQATQVDTTSSELGKTETSDRISTLPIADRNFLRLAVLQAGAVTPIQVVSAHTPESAPGGIGISPNVNGMRNNANNFLLDGSDNNEPFLGMAAVVPSIESIQEFKLITGLAPAEYGRSGGSALNVITKSGSNEFHGSVWEFLRNDALNARNFFANTTRPLIRNKFGAAAGGPLITNNTFFFVSYEGTRERRGRVRATRVPSAAERQGDFSASPNPIIDFLTGMPFPGNIIPPARFNPAADLVKNLWPLAPGGGNDLVSQIVVPFTDDQFSIKIDQTLGSADRLSVRYLFDEADAITPFRPTLRRSTRFS